MKEGFEVVIGLCVLAGMFLLAFFIQPYYDAIFSNPMFYIVAFIIALFLGFIGKGKTGDKE